MATAAADVTTRGLTFYQKMVLGISAFIILGFAQFSLRGYSNFSAAPFTVHLHGIAMLAWLLLLNVQTALVARGGIALHRTLGTVGALLAVFITGLGMYSGLRAVELGRVPPFFTHAYFIALSNVGVLAFLVMICAAIARRNSGDWHKRLMIGALVLIMEPAFGRVLPMPLMGGWGEWTIMVLQLATVVIMMRHDQRELGHVHPASQVAALSVVLTHVLITLVSMLPPVIGLAERLSA